MRFLSDVSNSAFCARHHGTDGMRANVYVCGRKALLSCGGWYGTNTCTHGHMHAHPCPGPSASSKVGLLNDPRVGRLACFDNAAVKKKKKKRKHGEEKTAGIRDRNKRFAHRQHAVSSI